MFEILRKVPIGCLVLFVPHAARAVTIQNFAEAGTPYTSLICQGTTGTSVQSSGGPTGGAYIRMTEQTTYSATSIAFQRSDPGAFTRIQIQFDFRLTPASSTNRADGFGVGLLNTVSYGNSGGECIGTEEPNLLGSFGIGFDIYQNAGDVNNNHISIHHAGSVRNTFISPVDLGSGQWIRARIVVRPGAGFSDASVYLTPPGGSEIAVVTNQGIAGLNPYESRVYFAARTGGQVASHDLANINVTYAADPAVVGAWSSVKNLPTVPIHSLMLPNQRVMFWDRHEPPGDIIPRLWNPANESTTPTPNPILELFCAGHSFDPQGRALILGGHDGKDGFGLATAVAYDYATNTYKQMPNMNAGRWYPTSTAMGNGDTLVISGSITPDSMNPTPQVWQDRTQSWRSLTGANQTMTYYPMMFLAPNGYVFNAGPNANTRFLNTAGTGSWGSVIQNTGGTHDYGIAVIHNGRVTVFGGGFTTNIVEEIDLNSASPTWRRRTPMAYARRQHNGVILADGNILITGGSETPNFNDNAGAILASEIWNPSNDSWSMGAAMAVSRLYHSETVLLPDGRVASLGGGHPAAINGGSNNFNLEIYSPPYLFKGARPVITSAPSSGANGQTFFVSTPDGARISRVHLIRLNAVTHSFDQNQRLDTLPFSVVGGGINVTVPSNPNVTPPGHYWLFLVRNTGVPSIGRMFSVQRAYQQSTGTDGVVSIEVERFHDNVAQGGHSWNRISAPGASGTGAQQSLPNNGGNVDTGQSTGAPRMDFWVNFTKTGTHHVWARGMAGAGSDDSYHFGLDGAESATSNRIYGFVSTWSWRKITMDGPDATVNVTSTGLHRVSIWMREDGLILDKLVLTTNAAYAPSDTGPAESAPY